MNDTPPTEATIKEAYRLFWMVKGHLNVDQKTALGCADSYFNRLWGNTDGVYRSDGFDEAWDKKVKINAK